MIIDTPRGVGGKIDRNLSSEDQALQAFSANNARLNSSTLTAQPAFKITPPNPSPKLDILGGAMEMDATMTGQEKAQKDTFNQDLQKEALTAKKDTGGSLQAYMDELIGGPTKSDVQDQVFTKTVDPIEDELDEINKELREEQHGLRRAQEALIQNPGGFVGQGLQDKLAEMRRTSLSTQADLYIKQAAIQGRFDKAEERANRAVDAIMEQRENKLAALKLNYEHNKALFTTAEQRAFETIQKQREFDLQMERDLLFKEYDQKLKEADPKYQLELRKLRQEISEGGTVAITNPAATPYAGALNVILGSEKFTQAQKASLIASVNSGDDPLAVIKNQAKNVMGQTQATDLGKLETAYTRLDDIDTLLKEFYAKGGTTNIFSGSYEQAVNKLGEVNDPRLVDISTRLGIALQDYRLAVTGTAASVQEDQKIEVLFPGITKSEGLNKARMGALKGSFQVGIDSKYRQVLGTTYDQIIKAAQTGLKGQMSDAQFVETTLKQKGANYQDALKQVPPGRIGVINNKTGAIGSIDPSKFNPALYTRL